MAVKPDLFLEMQKAVDIVNGSPHPTNKIAATVFGCDQRGEAFSIARTNYWPAAIYNHLGCDTRIGNSSGTLHAETACILQAPYTEGASIAITDPFCPNCAKNIAEAGIKHIFIDHKGFDKDFAARRHHHFEAMSMQICEKAGISVYEIWRKKEEIIPIFEVPGDYQPQEENPVQIKPVAEAEEEGGKKPAMAVLLKNLVRGQEKGGEPLKYGLALARDGEGRLWSLCATAHPAVGYVSDQDQAAMSAPEGKYSFILEPVNRLLMNAPRHGLKIVDNMLYASQIPTAREQVNLVGAGITGLYVGKAHEARDQDALDARDTLQGAGILLFRDL